MNAPRASKRRRCKNHDYVERLYREYNERIFRYIYKRTSNKELAADLTSQVFLRALEADLRGKGAHSSESGWIFRIAHNSIIDFYRQRDQRGGEPYELDTLDWIRGEDSGEQAPNYGSYLDAQRALALAVKHLTDEQFQVIQMWAMGFRFWDIAEAMGKTEGAVKALLHRARVTMIPKLRAMTDMEPHPWTELRRAA